MPGEAEAIGARGAAGAGGAGAALAAGCTVGSAGGSAAAGLLFVERAATRHALKIAAGLMGMGVVAPVSVVTARIPLRDRIVPSCPITVSGEGARSANRC